MTRRDEVPGRKTRRRARLGTVMAAWLFGAIAATAPLAAADMAVEEARSVSDLGLPASPNAIRFSDRQREGGAPQGAAPGLVGYADWAKAFPAQREMLALHPGYAEPTVTTQVNGLARTREEKLQVYVAAARFLVERPPAAVDLGRLATLAALAQVDPAIAHRPLARAEALPNRDPDFAFNRRPDRAWCEGPRTECFESRYQLEGKLPLGIRLANKLEEGGKKVSEQVTFQSEMRVLGPEAIDAAAAARLTGLPGAPASELDQTIFQVNQIIRFGKLVALVQPAPSGPGRSVVSLYLVLALKADVLERKKEYERVPVLRNLVPASVLMGASSFNTGTSLSAGVPVYARSRIRLIAAMLAGG